MLAITQASEPDYARRSRGGMRGSVAMFFAEQRVARKQEIDVNFDGESTSLNQSKASRLFRSSGRAQLPGCAGQASACHQHKIDVMMPVIQLHLNEPCAVRHFIECAFGCQSLKSPISETACASGTMQSKFTGLTIFCGVTVRKVRVRMRYF